MSREAEEIAYEEWMGAVLRSNPEHVGRMSQIDGAIQEGYGDPLFSIADVAAATDLSERRVRQILEEQGTCFRVEVENYRMERAEKLLAATTWAISAIAEVCGYRSASSFTRRFRIRHNGTTPVAYRKNAGGPARVGHATGAFRKPAERARARRRGQVPPSMRREGWLPGEAEAFQARMCHAERRAELRGELRPGGGISIVEMTDLLERDEPVRGS